jgi:hypothetical protein
MPVDRRLRAWIEGEIRALDVARHQSRTLERAADPRRDPLHQPLELPGARGRDGYEPQAPDAVPAIDAVEREQVKMRLNWFEDRFFSDPFTTDVVPYQIWSLHSLPPIVKF